jgi:hypothetical protein
MRLVMPRIKIKETVKLNDMSPQILLAINVAASIYAAHQTECVVTSLNDSGKWHRQHSLHAIGHAVDLRTKNLPLGNAEKLAFKEEVSKALGGRFGPFDVILENVGANNEHLHIEYQPHHAVGG